MSPRRVAAAAVLGALTGTAVVAGNVALPAPAGAATNGAMVAFGDSVPSGAVCHCRPFPQRYARKVSAHTGRPVRMTNDAFGGARSAGVVAQLDDRDVRKAVAGAGTALVMVGANDFGPAFHEVLEHRARARTVFPPVTRQVRANVVTIVRKLRRIRPGIRVLVADYWGVMKDGAVGRRRYGAWGMRKADQATADANRALREAADTTHAVYVSTFRAFKGPDGTDDPTPLLAPDGDHPNSRGHAVIADAFFRAAPAG